MDNYIKMKLIKESSIIIFLCMLLASCGTADEKTENQPDNSSLQESELTNAQTTQFNETTSDQTVNPPSQESETTANPSSQSDKTIDEQVKNQTSLNDTEENLVVPSNVYDSIIEIETQLQNTEKLLNEIETKSTNSTNIYTKNEIQMLRNEFLDQYSASGELFRNITLEPNDIIETWHRAVDFQIYAIQIFGSKKKVEMYYGGPTSIPTEDLIKYDMYYDSQGFAYRVLWHVPKWARFHQTTAKLTE